MGRRPAIAIVGSGNVATHLALTLDKVAEVRQVCSPCAEHAEALASRLSDCEALTDVSKIDPTVDFCIISVKDDAVRDVSEALPQIGGIVCHTSGSAPMEALCKHSRAGVFYPLQTFSKDAEVNVDEAPFFIEATDDDTLNSLMALARSISNKVAEADSSKRAILHVAAVFACNFANHLWAISSDILGEHGIGLDVMRPLLQATLDKAMTMPPAEAQTGPAVRRDEVVMQKHMSMLSPENAEIYKLLSQSIMSHKK
ncbi:MAG: DUF2520 domain-containing protein [Muribaculaceae bacterium]|nr:DUF2520 domain-containing protein [Muribaculaceae bacterium]